ncbi:MutS protein msh4 [Tilletia horrida]|nr:MutS protein msh4 [Tilletia horrida]
MQSIYAISNRAGRVTLCQLADTQTYIKTVQHLSLTGVAVLLAPGNASTVSGSSPFPGERSHNPASNHNSVLLQCVQEAFGVNPTYIHRRHWNEKEGAAYIERLIAPDTETATALASEQKTSDTASSRTNVSAPRTQTSSDILSGKVTGTAALTAASSKYYALSAACALFRYLESADNTSFRPSSLMIEYRCPEGVLFIGADTVRALELLENNLNRKSKQCMFGLMNFCATPMAERLLRMNLLQPLTDRDTIESRHDAVEEMVQSEERYASINQSLKPLGQNKIDADKLISQVCMSERTDLRNAAQVESKIANVLALRTFVRSIRPARHALDGCSSGLLRAVRMFLDSDELDEIAEAVEACINDDMLEGKKKRNQRMLDSMNEVLLLSDQTVEELRQEITERVGSLFKASEAIAILDMLASFAHLATVQNCVRPELTNSLVVSNGRHPILARFPTQKLVGNDIYASEGKSFTMINGPNMSGKSTYLQQIALLVIMASVGSFVPADYASFPTYDAILTCECRADNLAQQLSSFAAEMRATSFILSAATTRSLVLIDELGRATSTSEGFGFSYAVAEHLLNSGTTTFWATHLTELNVVLSKHFNFCHRTFQVDVSKRGKEVSMEFHHRIIDGEMSHPKLGLELARLAGVPKQVCETASKLAAELRESEERQRAKSKANAVLQRRKIIMKLDALLRQTLDVSRLPPKDLRRFLARIQDEATDELYETYTDGESKEAESASLQGCGDGEAMDECPDLAHESG